MKEDLYFFSQNIGLIGVTNFLIGLSGIILLPILTKNLSIEDYGIWVTTIATVGFLPLLMNIGLPFAFIRFYSSNPNKNEISSGFYSILIIVITSSLLISFSLLVFQDNIVNVFFNGNRTAFYLVILIIITESILLLSFNYFRAFQQIQKYSVFQIVKNYLKIPLIFFVMILNYKVIAVLLILLFNELIILLIVLYEIFREIPFNTFNFSRMKDFFEFCIPTIPGDISNWILRLGDRYFITFFLGLQWVGYYAPGATLGTLISYFSIPFNFLLPSVLPKYYDSNQMNKVFLFISFSLKYFLICAIPFLIIFIYYSKFILIVFSTQEIAENSYMITPIIALAWIVFGIVTILTQILILEKRTKIIGMVWIISAIINFTINLFIIKTFGIMGAAFTTFLSFVIVLILIVLSIKDLRKFLFKLDIILKMVACGVCMSFVSYFLIEFSNLYFFIQILFCGLVYVICIDVLKMVSKQEKDLLYSIILNIFKKINTTLKRN